MSAAIINFNSQTVELHEIENNFYILEKDLVRVLETSLSTIRKQRQRNPLIFVENRHFIRFRSTMVIEGSLIDGTNRHLDQERVYWSPRGISRLLMRKSSRCLRRKNRILQYQVKMHFISRN